MTKRTRTRVHSIVPELSALRPWFEALDGTPRYIEAADIKAARRCRAVLYAAKAYDKDTYAAIYSTYEDYPLNGLTTTIEKTNGKITVCISPDPLVLAGLIKVDSHITPELAWQQCKDRMERREVAERKRRGKYVPSFDELFPPEPAVRPPTQQDYAPPTKEQLAVRASEIAAEEAAKAALPPPETMLESYIITTEPFLAQLRHYQGISHNLNKEQMLQLALARATKALNGKLAGADYKLSPELEKELNKAVNKEL